MKGAWLRFRSHPQVFLLERVWWEFWDRDILVLDLSKKLHHHRCQIIQRLLKKKKKIVSVLNSNGNLHLYNLQNTYYKLWIFQQNDKQGRFYKRFSIRPKPKWKIFCALHGPHTSLHLLLATFKYEYLSLFVADFCIYFFNRMNRKSLQIEKWKCSSSTSMCKS